MQKNYNNSLTKSIIEQPNYFDELKKLSLIYLKDVDTYEKIFGFSFASILQNHPTTDNVNLILDMIDKFSTSLILDGVFTGLSTYLKESKDEILVKKYFEKIDQIDDEDIKKEFLRYGIIINEELSKEAIEKFSIKYGDEFKKNINDPECGQKINQKIWDIFKKDVIAGTRSDDKYEVFSFPSFIFEMTSDKILDLFEILEKMPDDKKLIANRCGHQLEWIYSILKDERGEILTYFNTNFEKIKRWEKYIQGIIIPVKEYKKTQERF